MKLLPTFMFPSDDDPDAMAVRQGLDQALDFGGSVDVPARYVATLDIQASDEVKHLLGWTDDRSGQVSFISMPHPMEPPVRGAFSVLDGVDRCSLVCRCIFANGSADVLV